MKKRFILVMLAILSLLSVFVVNIKEVDAKDSLSTSPYTTQIIGLDGELVNSSTAYEGIYVANLGFNNPSDIFIDDNDIVYIADKGNKVIMIYNHQTKDIRYVGKGVLGGPTGVCVTDDGNIYVADSEKKEVYKFDNTGNLLATYGRPTAHLYGEETQYIPTKVAVDSANNIYITCQGNSNGIVQLNAEGEFLGYFGPNKVTITFQLMFRRMFMSKEDREIYASLSPKATTNITIDNRNTVYSVIEGETATSLKKFNVNGLNILAGDTFFSNSYQDICIDDNGFIYAVDTNKEGVISVIDTEGNLLFKFGNTIAGSSTIGQFDKASGIDVDSKGNIWVTDALSNNIQVFMRTDYANTVMNALLNYNEGEYDRAVELYNEVLEMNSSFVKAYVGLGKIAQREQKFEEALEYFEIANYKAGYSEVYWEIRDAWMSKYMLIAILVVVLLLVLKIFHMYSKAYRKFMPMPIQNFFKKLGNTKLMEELRYLGHIMRHPFDTFYEIKFKTRIRFRTALGLFAFFVVMNIVCDYYITGYLFRTVDTSSFNLAFELLKWGLIIIVFVIANYLISTLQNGEGFFRDIFISTIFCFAPLLLFKLPLSIVSNVLTYNESYLYDLATTVLWAWSIFNIVIMLKDVHNYKLGGLILNIVLTVIAMIVLVLVYLVVYILSMQFFEFFINLIKEAALIYG